MAYTVKINGKLYTFRNIQEQVEFVTKEIEGIKSTEVLMSTLGIRVVGHVDDIEDLPSTYLGDYGDAYTVGSESPYDFLIWTRPDAQHESAYWFNMGEIPAPGPQGPQGIQGPIGETGLRGSRWYVETSNPTVTSGYLEKDVWVNALTGAVYQLKNPGNDVLYWSLEGNIKGPQGPQGIQGIQGPIGPQGPQGIQGNTGPAGGITNVRGQVNAETDLPDARIMQYKNDGYLVGTTVPYNLYIIVGDADDRTTWQWMNIGTWGAGNIAFVDVENVFSKNQKVIVPGSASSAIQLGQNVNTFIRGSTAGEMQISAGSGIISARSHTAPYAGNQLTLGRANLDWKEIYVRTIKNNDGTKAVSTNDLADMLPVDVSSSIGAALQATSGSATLTVESAIKINNEVRIRITVSCSASQSFDGYIQLSESMAPAKEVFSANVKKSGGTLTIVPLRYGGSGYTTDFQLQSNEALFIDIAFQLATPMVMTLTNPDARH